MKNWKQDCTLWCWKDRWILALFFTGYSKGFYLWLHWFLQIRRPSWPILAILFKLEGAWRGELFLWCDLACSYGRAGFVWSRLALSWHQEWDHLGRRRMQADMSVFGPLNHIPGPTTWAIGIMMMFCSPPAVSCSSSWCLSLRVTCCKIELQQKAG